MWQTQIQYVINLAMTIIEIMKLHVL